MTRRRWAAYARLFEGERPLLAFSIVISILQSALLIPVAVLVKRVFDTQIPRGDTGGLVVSGVLILGLYLGSAALGLVTRYVVLKITKEAVTRLRVRLLERLYELPQAYFDRHSAGALQSIVVQDSERLDVMSNALVAQLLPAFLVTGGLCAIAIVLSPLLFLALVCVVPLLILLGRVLSRGVRSRTRRWYEVFETFSSQTGLALRAMTLTKVHAAERLEIERRARQLEELGRAGRDMAWFYAAYMLVQGAVAASAGVVVLVVGGWATARGDMTLGELLAFYAIVALILRQLTTIVSSMPYVLSGYEAIARLDEILEADEREEYSGTRPASLGAAITLDGVSFSYGAQPLLREVSLTVGAGEQVAIVGPNGAGKSTLVSLILGLYRPQSGRLLADGIPYDDLDLRSLRSRIGVVLQDPVIFPGTVAENIAYGRPDASEQEIGEAAAWATADAVISDLPDGYATEVGDEGGLLSGGQRQRIAIARALLARPALLMLDEPTTHLDDAAIAQLMANLRELPGSPTLVMISHDTEVARRADRVHHLRDGRLVDDGRPTPALARSANA